MCKKLKNVCSADQSIKCHFWSHVSFLSYISNTASNTHCYQGTCLRILYNWNKSVFHRRESTGLHSQCSLKMRCAFPYCNIIISIKCICLHYEFVAHFTFLLYLAPQNCMLGTHTAAYWYFKSTVHEGGISLGGMLGKLVLHRLQL